MIYHSAIQIPEFVGWVTVLIVSSLIVVTPVEATTLLVVMATR
jgi:hypothetical protein